jgi:hypothetical protein
LLQSRPDAAHRASLLVWPGDLIGAIKRFYLVGKRFKDAATPNRAILTRHMTVAGMDRLWFNRHMAEVRQLFLQPRLHI